jgi:hypothetical protein
MRLRVDPIFVEYLGYIFRSTVFNKVCGLVKNSGGHKTITIIGIVEYSANNNYITGTMPLSDYMRMMARYGYVILRLQ